MRYGITVQSFSRKFTGYKELRFRFRWELLSFEDCGDNEDRRRRRHTGAATGMFIKILVLSSTPVTAELQPSKATQADGGRRTGHDTISRLKNTDMTQFG